MKIALVTDGITPFSTGGMQKHSANLAKWLTKNGTEVTLLHAVDYDKDIPSTEVVNQSLFGNGRENLTGIIGVHFPKPGKIPGHYIRNSYKLSKKYFELIENQLNDFDFIYGKGFTLSYFLEQKNKGVNLPPLGVKFHGYEMFQYPPSLKVKLQHLLLRKSTIWNNKNADVVFSYGGKISDIISKIGVESSKIIEIPTGIDDDWIREQISLSTQKRRFVFIGRFERRKGVEELNAVLKRLLEKHINFKFEFIGPIPENVQIKSEQICYHGILKSKSAIVEVLDRSDVLVCPSYSEGMPNVIMEGMARGLAIIATDVGAVSIQVDESNGWILEKPEVNLIEQAILNAIESPDELLNQKKRNSLQKVETRFRWNTIAKQTISEIKRYLDDKSR